MLFDTNFPTPSSLAMHVCKHFKSRDDIKDEIYKTLTDNGNGILGCGIAAGFLGKIKRRR